MANENTSKIARLTSGGVEKLANFEARQQAYFDEVSGLGIRSGQGATTIYELCVGFQTAVREKLINDGDSVAVYTRYAASHNKVIDESPVGATVDRLTEKSISSQASKLKGFAYPAALHMGVSLYIATANAWRDLPSDNRAVDSTMAAFNRINTRAQKLLKKLDGKTEELERILTKTDWIAENLSKTSEGEDGEGASEEKSTKTDLQKFSDLVKSMAKLSREGFASDTRFVDFAAYAEKLHAKMVAESKVVGSLPALD
jgi:hypothetical protein